MKNLNLIIFAAAFISGAAFARPVQTMHHSNEPAEFGVGVILGDPTGLSAKYNLDSVQAIDLGIGWSFTGNGRLHVHGDYLRHVRGIFDIESASFDLHYGIGGRFKLRESDSKKSKNDTDPKIGLRLPVGLDYTFQNVPIETFVEAALIVDLAPTTQADFNAGIGARWFF